MADVTEGTVFGLGIAQTIVLDGYGIATSVGIGTSQANAQINPVGTGSAAAIGVAKSNASVNPAGINAASGAAGLPQFNANMQPTGVASGEQFGDPETIATAFIVPGPIDPSNDFGDPVVTKRGWVFRNPTIQLGWRFQKRYEGVSLLKENGVWVEVSHPDLERTKTAEKYLPGGHDHVVSDDLKADLIAAGYTVTDEVVTTEVYES